MMRICQLCTPHSSSQEAVDTTVGELSASVSSIATCPLKVEDEQKDHLVNAEPFSPARASRTVSSFAEEQEEGMKIEALIKFSAKGIMDLACSANSPIILRNRNQEIIKSVNEFLESIKGLRISTQ